MAAAEGDHPLELEREVLIAELTQFIKLAAPGTTGAALLRSTLMWASTVTDNELRRLLASPTALHERVIAICRASASEKNPLVIFKRNPVTHSGLIILPRACVDMCPHLSLHGMLEIAAERLDDNVVSVRRVTLVAMWPHLRRAAPLLIQLAAAEQRVDLQGVDRDEAFRDAFSAAAPTPKDVFELMQSAYGFLGMDSAGSHADVSSLAKDRMAMLLRAPAHARDVGTLRMMLGVRYPGMSDAEAAEARNEPLFTRVTDVAPPALTRGWTGLSDGEPDALVQCLERCDARTLRELKAVSRRWCERTRRVLTGAAWRASPVWSAPEGTKALIAALRDQPMRARNQLMALDPSVELPAHVEALLPMLKDADWDVRDSVVQVLGKLDPSVLAEQVDVLLPMLTDAEVVQVLGKLDPPVLADWC